jgi:hypothetical protein
MAGKAIAVLADRILFYMMIIIDVARPFGARQTESQWTL